MKSKEKITASAPAKAILFGEHAVVYGKKALATAIDKRFYVEVSQRKEGDGGCHVKIANIPTFGLEIDLGLDFSEHQKRPASVYMDYGAAAKVIAFLTESLRYLGEKYGIGLASASASSKGEGVEIKIRSEIPLSAGLGSSAATCVATIAAMREYFDISGDMEEIRRDAHGVEKEVQGVASPIDTAISTYGGYVEVEKKEVRRLKLPFPDIPFIVGCIGNPSLSLGIEKNETEMRLKTKKLVEGVRIRRGLFEGIFDKVFDTMDEITGEGIKAMEKKNFREVGMLMSINHGLLEAIGVVSRRLSVLVKTAQEIGALGAKVTGAGAGIAEGINGGSVLVLPPVPEERHVASEIKAAMKIEGAFVMDARAGTEGLKIEFL